MQISASIYSDINNSLIATSQNLDRFNVDYFHIDCNENEAVFNDIRLLNSLSKTAIDLHLICHDPLAYKEFIDQCDIYKISIQFEALANKKSDYSIFFKQKIGLAIGNETDLTELPDYINNFDYIQLMTTTPGKSGGKFSSSTFQRVKLLRKLFPDKRIQVDGGVNAEVNYILRHLGVNEVVVGSYLFNNELIHSIWNLRKFSVASDFRLKDFMMLLEEIPVLLINECSIENALILLEKNKSPYLLLVNDSGFLEGLVSMADIRRAIVKSNFQFQEIKMDDFVNRTPLTCKYDDTVHDMLEFIKTIDFPIQYLPLVDDNNILKGAVQFNDLIKGE